VKATPPRKLYDRATSHPGCSSDIGMSDSLRGATCLVTGGSGYLGQRICLALFAAGACEVRTLDLSSVDTEQDGAEVALLARVKRFTGDVRVSADVCAAMAGCTVVFHAASYGMSGREMLDRHKTRSVNLNGTATVLAAAQTLGVKRLVYTSSYNAVFGGRPIYNGDETLPMFPPAAHVDEYSRTKALAERAVLAAHDPPRLATCALRCAAIYGPVRFPCSFQISLPLCVLTLSRAGASFFQGETRHFPRIARLASLGAVCFSIGPPSVRVDWVHGDDLAAAHVLAASALGPGGPAGGQSYFINDGQPVNQTEFLMPLIKACGGRDVTIWLPVWMLLAVAYVIQFTCLFVWRLTRGAYLPSPLLLPAEVYKVGVTHTFSCAKATRELGYTPRVKQADGMAATVAALMRRRAREARRRDTGRKGK
jgi:nucleoside-diphosphate-sugar epimerase